MRETERVEVKQQAHGLTEGAKYDEGKPRWDLLPIDALNELVAVLSFGAGKYDDRNWEKGINYSRVYGAAMRHLTKFWNGQDKDDETDLAHLAHAMCCCMFLLSYQLRSMKEFDDRPRNQKPNRDSEQSVS